LFFLLRKVLFGFSEGAPPVGCRRVHSHRFSHEFPEDPPILPIDSAIEPNKYQVVIPLRVRQQIGVAVGDILEVKVERGKITLTPRSVVDRAIAEGLEDVRKGRVRGPFKTVDETIDSLKGRKRRTTAKA